MILTIKNFNNISFAAIKLNALVVFVGPNNSGKTQLLQLLHGVTDFISQHADASMDELNTLLQTQKNHIVHDIFGEYLPIESLELFTSDDENKAYNSLFLPVDRTGLAMLSQYYKPDETGRDKIRLSKPMHEFMAFIKHYEFDKAAAKKHQALLDFINSNLIHGEFRWLGDELKYIPNTRNAILPIYNTASVISQLSPVMQLLTGKMQYTHIFYDNIEDNLHPLLQIEMARLLIRMVNAGYRIAVSTHSDTFAAALDNLILLTHASFRDERAKLLKYTQDDILCDALKHSVSVYQFDVNPTTHKTFVNETESYLSLGIGYNFDTFRESNNRLYNDARIIMGIQ